MTLTVENTDGQIRVSVHALSEVIAREVVQVPGVIDTFESLLHSIKFSENGQFFQINDKIDVQHRSLEVSVVISLDPNCIFWKVASDVQNKIYSVIEKQFGFSLKKVNIEVGKVEWFIT
ncbi:MAG: Asp23/Gls24 family envelope stress response protein [Candidatus Atribacteria bacterium]|nr:Asp23/Gls24 family envelope stress response protein [Candidatus Atribacteria bacterium]